MRKMLLSPQHPEFGDQQEMLLVISPKTVDHTCLKDLTILIFKANSSQIKGFFDSGCSRQMTRNKSFLIDYQEIDDGFVAFRESPKGDLNPDFMRPFGCPDTILNTLDHLGKFEWKADEGFLVGYSVNSKAFKSSDDKDADKAPGKGDEGVSKGSGINNKESLNINTVGSNNLIMPSLEETGIFDDVYNDREVGAEADTNNLELSTIVSHIPTTRVHKDHPKEQTTRDLNLATQTRRMINFSEENAMADTNNLELSTIVSHVPTTRVHKDHPKEQITEDLNLATQTRRMINFSEENAM
nr:ribonuclease H-like domain-containing protein [Tanacetum cinerariifolium]